MARDDYVRQLIARVKDGTIPEGEVKEIARSISEGRTGRDLYRFLYAVARAGGPAYESLVAGCLIHPEDPEVSALAVQVLTGHWRMGAKYRVPRDAFDAELLRALLQLAEEGRGEYDDDLMQRLAVEAIARALGAGHAESLGPPAGVTRAEWSQGLLRAVRERLHDAAPQL
ncbi:hypothetical protein ABZ619_03685 [Streptomyces sp. NPDC007851]|uniref:hypothetical protein n=1 Tax=Streptomyces sp. NPDC007851 TaxID=3155008 RepID=UPI0033D6C55C